MDHLEPFAEVQRALLVVEVLHLPHPELGGLLSGGKGRVHLLIQRGRKRDGEQWRGPSLRILRCTTQGVVSENSPVSASADVAERLRRLTRNQLGSPRAGSSPAVCESPILLHLHIFFTFWIAIIGTLLPHHKIGSNSDKWRQDANVAEWLRRLTWNQLGSPRVGSNPAVCEK